MDHLILAVDFFQTDIGKPIAAIMKAVAIVVVIGAAFKGFKDVMSGKIGKAAQLVIGAAVVVAFLWDPSLITKLIDLASGLAGKGVSSVEQITR